MARGIFPHEVSDPDFQWLIKNYMEKSAPVAVVDAGCLPLVMVLLGGLGTVFGPVIGAICYLALEELVWRNFLTVHAAVLGGLIVVLVLFLPNGLGAMIRQRRKPVGAQQ